MTIDGLLEAGRRHSAPFREHWKGQLLLFVGAGVLTSWLTHGLEPRPVATNVAIYLSCGLAVAGGRVVFETTKEVRDGRVLVAGLMAVGVMMVAMVAGLALVALMFGPNPPFFWLNTGM